MKNQKYDNTDEYYVYINDKILNIAPLAGVGAGLTFTLAYLFGQFKDVSVLGLIFFDLACLSYFLVAYLLKRYGIVRNGVVSKKAMDRTELFLDLVIIFQWNLISYLAPVRAFWGYAPMFVLLSSFMFHTKAVGRTMIGISLSIAVSWLINGEKLLPVADESYIENCVLRVVALVVSFSVIYSLTYYSEKFTVAIKNNFDSIEKKNRELELMGTDVIAFAADIIEERDAVSGSHVKRMKEYVRILAEKVAEEYPEYELNENKVEQIVQASMLHDVGKIGVPDSILLKPGRLTAEEFEVIKSHTTIGARLIDKLPDSIGSDYKRYCREICLFHHEKYDGKGYPSGLVGDDIPISAQIVSVIDCFDALSNERPYKPALPAEVALNMILNGECGVFSEKIKTSILECKDELLKV